MSKAFTKESEQDDDDALPAHLQIPANAKNYMTPKGWNRLREELHVLVTRERPELTQMIAWAAGNGDRSENGDYIYGKKRLREIDRRIRFLTKRLENAEVVDPESREPTDQIFFGATVTYARPDGSEHTISIVGIDELDLDKGYVTWISPIARTLTRAREGDVVVLRTPAGDEELEILQVEYKALD
ncbi:transcription elongation factor GreB [Chitinimonas sp. DQS-5]|uniref:Transcription elongation factor GreB n=2 Tax=Parachitinimonas caeni TaxID=3031301 RepID=A0ABT7E2U6_9NEIS|nr:transcription elongation factor GreB [Parachitinimonas caeni]MDK2126569.1 transcription elongation factor GreB [Parachitinimonas caeni]